MFNGGNYRTCTFRVDLCTDQGKAGRSLGGRELFVRLEIERAPNTADNFFSPKAMARHFLSRKNDLFLGAWGPIADRVALETLKPWWRWRADYPLGRIPASGRHRLAGVIYLCQESRVPAAYYYFGVGNLRRVKYAERRILGAKIWYGVDYRLSFADGSLSSASSIWLGPLWRPSRRRVPADEWFSSRPIPVKLR